MIVYVKNMAQLDKDDLAQMNEDYFKSLNQERLVEVAKNLHQLATDLWEQQQQNSENSSKPPSSDNPYTSNVNYIITTEQLVLKDTAPHIAVVTAPMLNQERDMFLR